MKTKDDKAYKKLHYQKWYAKNKEKKAEINKRWKSANADYVRSYEATRSKEKYDQNGIFKLKKLLRARLKRAINSNYKSGSAVDDLGCSIEEFKIHLEKHFQPGMCWSNHGDWEIDHIKPLKSFDLTNLEELRKACNYMNLQPIWKQDHLEKTTREAVSRLNASKKA